MMDQLLDVAMGYATMVWEFVVERPVVVCIFFFLLKKRMQGSGPFPEHPDAKVVSIKDAKHFEEVVTSAPTVVVGLHLI